MRKAAISQHLEGFNPAVLQKYLLLGHGGTNRYQSVGEAWKDSAASKSLSIFLFLLLFPLWTADSSPRLNPRRHSCCNCVGWGQAPAAAIAPLHPRTPPSAGAAPTDPCKQEQDGCVDKQRIFSCPCLLESSARKTTIPKRGGYFPSQLHPLAQKALAIGSVRK